MSRATARLSAAKLEPVGELEAVGELESVADLGLPSCFEAILKDKGLHLNEQRC